MWQCGEGHAPYLARPYKRSAIGEGKCPVCEAGRARSAVELLSAALQAEARAVLKIPTRKRASNHECRCSVLFRMDRWMASPHRSS